MVEQILVASSVTIPILVLVIAIVVTLVGITGWGFTIEQRKADRAEVIALKMDLRLDISEIKAGLKQLLDLHLRSSKNQQ